MRFYLVEYRKPGETAWKESRYMGRTRFLYTPAKSLEKKLEAKGLEARVRMARDARNYAVLVEKRKGSKGTSGWKEVRSFVFGKTWLRNRFTKGEAEHLITLLERRGHAVKGRKVLPQSTLDNRRIEKWLSGDLDFDRKLMVALSKVAAANRTPLHVNYGKRTYAEQAALYNKYGPGRAARPGTSRHETGMAADVVHKRFRWMNLGSIPGIRKHMRKYGVGLPVPGEAWHAEMTSRFNA